MADWAAVAVAAVGVLLAAAQLLQAVAITRLEGDPSRARLGLEVSGTEPVVGGARPTRVVLTCTGPTVRVLELLAYSDDGEPIDVTGLMTLPGRLTAGNRRLLVVRVPPTTATFELAVTYELDLPWLVRLLNGRRMAFAWSGPLAASDSPG